MYYVYVDEAGISANEPVTVVTGVILNSIYWRLASNRLNNLFDIYVPKDLRVGFHFHAKTIWAGYRSYDEMWPRVERAKFIAAVASIPRELNAAISVGKVRRDWIFPINKKMKLHDFHHIMAFYQCLARANKYIQDWGLADEIGTVVAEDISNNKKYLKAALKYKAPSVPLTSEYILMTEREKIAGKVMQNNASGPMDRLVDTVHFALKDEAPLLQISDACAFSFRKYFADQAFGKEIITQILGGPLDWSDWQGPISQVVFSFNETLKLPSKEV